LALHGPFAFAQLARHIGADARTTKAQLVVHVEQGAHIKFVAHGITVDKARAYLGLHPNFTFFILVLLPLLLAIAITPLMNRIDKFLMAKLFPRANK
jgi:hypothetical protein